MSGWSRCKHGRNGNEDNGMKMGDGDGDGDAMEMEGGSGDVVRSCRVSAPAEVAGGPDVEGGGRHTATCACLRQNGHQPYCHNSHSHYYGVLIRK